jgi:Uma2 family endonuclease
MAETDWHRILMGALIDTLDAWYADQPMVYVSGNLLIFYVPGNKRRHVAPDVFVVKGVPKHLRLNYLVWEEGKPPTLVIELTSSTTRREDRHKKFLLYQDVLKVQEYFLFDPYEDYLDPPMQGYRLWRGKYIPIRADKGRLPSRVLGLHLERDGKALRLYDSAADQWLPTSREEAVEAKTQLHQTETQLHQTETQLHQTETQRDQARAAQAQAEAEVERLRRELAELRRLHGRQ